MKQIYMNFGVAVDTMIFVINNKAYESNVFFDSYNVMYNDEHYYELLNDEKVTNEELAKYVADCFRKHDDEENSTFDYMLEELESEIHSGLNYFEDCDMSIDEMIETYENDAFVKIYETED